MANLLTDQGLRTGFDATGGLQIAQALFRDHRGAILATYALLNLENLMALARPWAVGRAVDGLGRATYAGLAGLVLLHLTHLGIGTLRRAYDTRLFTCAHADLAARLVFRLRGRGVDTSRVVARSVLAREFSNLFENHIPLVIRLLYAMVGALALLAIRREAVAVACCLVLVVPVALLNMRYASRSLELSALLHDALEHEVRVVEQGDLEAIQLHYADIARCQVRVSDAEAYHFGLMELLVLALMVAALVGLHRSSSCTPGDVLAVLGYVMTFASGLDSIPVLVRQLSGLVDIGRRLNRDDP